MAVGTVVAMVAGTAVVMAGGMAEATVVAMGCHMREAAIHPY